MQSEIYKWMEHIRKNLNTLFLEFLNRFEKQIFLKINLFFNYFLNNLKDFLAQFDLAFKGVLRFTSDKEVFQVSIG